MTVKPFAHQAASLKHSDRTPIVFDTSDPGTGKTFVRIMAFAKRRRKGGGCLLVLAPRSLLRSVWQADIAKFAPHLKVSVADAANRAKAFDVTADVYITNVDAAKWLATQKPIFFKRFGVNPELAIDESDAYKHHTSQRSKAAAKIRKYFKYVCLMTGTPNTNSITDVWHQALILDGGERLGTSFYKFRDQVCTPEQVGRSQHAVKWHDREGAEEAVFGLLSDIVIRHRFEDCVDIPPNHQYTLNYELTPKQLTSYLTLQDTQMLWLGKQKSAMLAINAAAVRTKLLQVACICYDTPVLTERGWITIQNVLITDRVWDGEEWVTHNGSMLKGTTEVIKRHGVWMTPEHLVLTKEGWRDGESSEKFDRADVRFPDSYSTSRNNDRDSDPVRNLGMPMRMWKHRYTQKPIFARASSYSSAQLRMSARKQGTWNVEYPIVLQMVWYARSLLQPVMQGFQELGRAGHYGMRAMAQLLREFLFGHGPNLQAGSNTWASRQQQGVQPSKLSVGDRQRTGQQHPQQHSYRHSEGSTDYQASSRDIRGSLCDAACQITPLRLDDVSRTEPVYDLIDCGPRTRFVVMDERGKPLIVHNSGAVYDGMGGYAVIDPGRYEMTLDLVAQRNHSLVTFLWKHQRDLMVAEAEKRGISYCVMDGNTSDRDRHELVQGYQAGRYQVMFGHPATIAHGFTLTRGTTTIWPSPTDNLGWFVQGSKRQHRIGQTQKTETIVIVAPGTIDEDAWANCTGKEGRMNNLLDLFSSVVKVKKAGVAA